jgi:hypothetical protein
VCFAEASKLQNAVVTSRQHLKNNYIVITNSLFQSPELSTASPAQDANAKGIVFTTSSSDLSALAEQFQIPFQPVYAIAPRAAQSRMVQVVGVKDSEVWIGQGQGRGSFSGVRKLGKAVPNSEERLREYENSIAGSRLVLGYEQGGSSELIAILESKQHLYLVRKMSDNSFGIEGVTPFK